MKDLFEMAMASVPGRDHLMAGNLLIGKNNQDGFFCHMSDQSTVMIVCDGCSSGPQSEVGAKMCAQLLGKRILRTMHAQKITDEAGMHSMLEAARKHVLSMIRFLMNELGDSSTQTANGFFLFTIVGTVMTKDLTSIFSIGDGVFALNGDIVSLGPFPGNAPPYATYALLETACPAELLQFGMQRTVPTESVQTLCIGSDGVEDFIRAEEKKMPGKQTLLGPLSQFWTDNAYFKNPDALRRKLVLANSEVTRVENGGLSRYPGLLRDDTTICVLRRKEIAPCT